jgi:hypothetical protein
MWQLVTFFVGVPATVDSWYGVLVFRTNRHILGVELFNCIEQFNGTFKFGFGVA